MMKKIEETKKVGNPKTLLELGLPKELALRLEDAFEAIGATKNDRVVGFTFRSVDGASHAMRLSRADGEGTDRGPTDLAA